MKSFQSKNLGAPDETRVFPHGKVEIVQMGDFSLAQGTFEPGWRWSEHIKPIAGTTSCQVLHHGHLISGRMRVRMDDGTESEIGPGDVYIIPPGHDAWVVGDEPVLGFELASAMEFAKPS